MRLAEPGIDLKAIAEIVGQTSIRTTAMYVESNPKRLARILQDVTFWGRGVSRAASFYAAKADVRDRS